MKWKPYEYQRRALQFLLDHPRAQLWVDKGLGKTAVTLHAIDELMDRVEVARVLVVSTVRITQEVWPAEVEKWGLDIPVRDINGPAKHRSRMLDEPWVGIETVTFEKLKWLFAEHCHRRRGHPLPWDIIIFDESSKMKAVGTQRFRAVRRWVPYFPPRVWNLTGSPAPGGLLNLWGPAFLLDGGDRLGRRYVDFRERWFEVNYTGWEYTPRAHAEEDIRERLRDVTLSMMADDYLDLPPLVVNDIPVHLPPRAAQVYRDLERDMFVRLERGDVEVANGGVLTGKCRQVANGNLYVNGSTDSWEPLHREKLAAVEEVVEEAEGENIIIAYQFRSDLDALRRHFPSAVEMGDNVVRDWNAGKIPLLLIHPASAGHGLNLQGGGRQMILYGCPWSLDQYEQCIDRIAGGLRRQRPTIVHRILADETVDLDIVEALASRRTVQEVLKRRMQEPS